MRRAAPDAHRAAHMEADAGRGHDCGALYPTAELLAVVSSLSAVVVYVVAGLAFSRLWFWQ
jgi:hypothetical protein